ncbi:hypothetical protein Tco_0790450 [Tanacetum coccineum]
MGRDTIQLEDALSTISQEYLLEFSSEYFIPENLHLELPGPGDHIVDFPEGKIGVYTKKLRWMSFSKRPGKYTPQCYTKPLDSLKNWNNRFFWVDEKVFPTVVAWRTVATKDDKPQVNTYSVVDVATLDTHQMDLFNLIKAPNPTKVKTGTRQQTAHEVPLLTATVSRVIQMVDATKLSTSPGTPSTMESVYCLAVAEQEIPVTDDAWATEAIVEPNLEKEVISMGPTIRKRCRQRDAGEEGSKAPSKMLRKYHDAARAEHSAREGKSLAEMSVDTKLAIHAQETQEPPVATRIVNDPDPLSYAKPRSQQDVTQCRSSKEKGVTGNQDSKRSTPSPPIIGSLGSIYQPGWGVPNSCRLDTPEACQDVVDHIAPSGYFSELRHLSNDELLSQYNIKLARQVAMGSQLRLRFEQEAKLLKKSVAQELEDLRMRFSGLEVGNAQLSQQVSMLQAQVMGEKRIMAAFEEFKKHEDERVNARQAFANVVSVGIAKGMSEGLKYGVEHGKAGLELTAVEAYDPEADNKYVAALHNLKDLKYPLIDGLEQLKDAPLDLKIPVYPEVHDPRNLWACKEEILLEDAIAANISRAEKKKKTGWYAVPMGSVQPTMLGLMAVRCQYLPYLLKAYKSC